MSAFAISWSAITSVPSSSRSPALSRVVILTLASASPSASMKPKSDALNVYVVFSSIVTLPISAAVGGMLGGTDSRTATSVPMSVTAERGSSRKNIRSRETSDTGSPPGVIAPKFRYQSALGSVLASLNGRSRSPETFCRCSVSPAPSAGRSGVVENNTSPIPPTRSWLTVYSTAPSANFKGTTLPKPSPASSPTVSEYPSTS